MATGDLCTLAEARAFLELPAADTARDNLITTTIAAVSKAIQQYTQRELYPVGTATRIFKLPMGQYTLALTPFDLRSVTSLTFHADETALVLTAADYQSHPITNHDGMYSAVQFSNQVAELWNSDSARYFGYSRVTIVGTWGPAAIPVDVKQACVVSVAAAMRRDVVNLDLGDVLSDPRELGPDRPTNYALPAAALRLLGPYRRVGLL
jgi:hypothetical protein